MRNNSCGGGCRRGHGKRRDDIRGEGSAPPPKMPFSAQWLGTLSPKLEYDALRRRCEAAKIQWWDELVPCYTWLFGSGLPFEWYSRDAVHSGELGKQIIGRVMLGYFLTGR